MISNTVAIGISIRKEEIGIMKLIGATNFFVRAPFLIEGIIIGFIGSAIPLALLFVLYDKVAKYILTKFSMLSNVVQFMNIYQVFEVPVPVGLVLGAWGLVCFWKYHYHQKAFESLKVNDIRGGCRKNDGLFYNLRWSRMR